MRKNNGLALLAALALVSCSLQAQPAADPGEVATTVALTVQAAISQPAPLATPTQAAAAPTPGALNLAPETPLVQLTATLASTEARANFDDVVNCRLGPGINYDRVFQTKSGDSFKIVGFFPPNFWIISTGAGECWIAGEFTTPIGNLQAVPTVTLPPTPAGGAPKAPSFAKGGWKWFCYGSGQVEVELNWKDNASTEKGYRIYRNDQLITELAPNSTYFKEVIVYPDTGLGLSYKVEAFNEVGVAGIVTETLFCDL